MLKRGRCGEDSSREPHPNGLAGDGHNYIMEDDHNYIMEMASTA